MCGWEKNGRAWPKRCSPTCSSRRSSDRPGRLEIDTERETLNLRERFDKISADYNRVQFRLGSLQHLNTRLDDPRVAQQLDELVLEIRQLASKPA